MKLYVCTIGGLFQKFTLNILSDFTVYNRTKRMGAWLIIIRYCCGKQCELLLNRFLIRDTINLIYCHLPLSSIIDDKIRPPLLFKPRVGKKFRPPHLVSQPPHLKKNFDPPTSFWTIRTLREVLAVIFLYLGTRRSERSAERSVREERADSGLDISSHLGARPCWDLATRSRTLYLTRARIGSQCKSLIM